MEQPGRFHGRATLVTSGASGLGRGVALRLAREGASVSVVDLDGDGGRRIIEQIREAGGRAKFIRGDVTHPEVNRAMVAETLQAFGRLDGLVPSAGVGAGFGAAKGAVVNLTRSMAVAHARDGVRVNGISPGWVEAPINADYLADPERRRRVEAAHPMGRMGTPEEIAAAVAFLASDEASWITGTILPVDGGYFAAGPGS